MTNLPNSLYFTYRRTHSNRGGQYDPSYYNSKEYADFTEAGLTKMIDWNWFIPDDRITKELVPWIQWLRRAWVLEYQEWLDVADLQSTLLNTASAFGVELKTVEEMKQWIKDNTDLEEKSEWVYIINEEIEEAWETIPEKLLIIN